MVHRLFGPSTGPRPQSCLCFSLVGTRVIVFFPPFLLMCFRMETQFKVNAHLLRSAEEIFGLETPPLREDSSPGRTQVFFSSMKVDRISPHEGCKHRYVPKSLLPPAMNVALLSHLLFPFLVEHQNVRTQRASVVALYPSMKHLRDVVACEG